MTRRLLIILIGLLLISPGLHAEFSEPVLNSVRKLQSQILVQSQRNINAADAVATWDLFDQDVLQTLNSGINSMTIEDLNSKYGSTDIRIPMGTSYDKSVVKTGAIQIKFVELDSKNEGKKDWLTVYYHGLGQVPSSTFHIFRYDEGRYKRVAAMERTDFLNHHPKLLWNAIQVQRHNKKNQFSTYYVPVAGKARTNRSQVNWEWDGKRLRARRWIPEVDYHTKDDGTVVSGRGPVIDLP